MKIKKILMQSRRDFWADFECQFCGHVEKDVRGYDDANYHNNVIPTFVCPKCGKSTNSEHDTSYRPLTPKYPEWYQI